jgi:hypothetical protein
MADAATPEVSSVPAQPGQPYDAASDADCGAWVKLSDNVPGGSEDLWRTEFPDSPPWRQT